jgi:Coenzyme PQQ synthesis protein D (PqqD)
MTGGQLTPLKVDVSEVNEIADGLVLYQAEIDRVHYLNRTASIVYELCTGENSVEQIAALIGEAFGLASVPLGEVAECLATLRAEGLVR